MQQVEYGQFLCRLYRRIDTPVYRSHIARVYQTNEGTIDPAPRQLSHLYEMSIFIKAIRFWVITM